MTNWRLVGFSGDGSADESVAAAITTRRTTGCTRATSGRRKSTFKLATRSAGVAASATTCRRHTVLKLPPAVVATRYETSLCRRGCGTFGGVAEGTRRPLEGDEGRATANARTERRNDGGKMRDTYPL